MFQSSESKETLKHINWEMNEKVRLNFLFALLANFPNNWTLKINIIIIIMLVKFIPKTLCIIEYRIFLKCYLLIHSYIFASNDNTESSEDDTIAQKTGGEQP